MFSIISTSFKKKRKKGWVEGLDKERSQQAFSV
jgi:hypothetical protein